jgi:transcription elongation factor GreA-like protein
VSRKVGRLSSQLVPGSYVLHPDRPDWGVGQVQTVVGTRVTVNFENAGKQLINAAVVALVEVDPQAGDRP